MLFVVVLWPPQPLRTAAPEAPMRLSRRIIRKRLPLRNLRNPKSGSRSRPKARGMRDGVTGRAGRFVAVLVLGRMIVSVTEVSDAPVGKEDGLKLDWAPLGIPPRVRVVGAEAEPVTFRAKEVLPPGETVWVVGPLGGELILKTVIVWVTALLLAGLKLLSPLYVAVIVWLAIAKDEVV